MAVEDATDQACTGGVLGLVGLRSCALSQFIVSYMLHVNIHVRYFINDFVVVNDVRVFCQ